MSLFSDILNDLKPILTNDQLGFSKDILDLNVYSLDILSERANLIIMDIQPEVAFLEDLAGKKKDALDALSNAEKIDEENLEERKKLNKEIQDLKTQIDKKISDYIEALCDLQEGEFENKINGIYKNIDRKLKTKEITEDERKEYSLFLKCPKKHLVNSIFVKINSAVNGQKTEETGEQEKAIVTL